MNKAMKYLVLVSALLVTTMSQAELFRVGPSDVPSPAGHGFPAWYQDTNGLALDLCIPQTLNQLDACLATPAPGDPLPTLPYSFPDNWPDEFFWYAAEALMDIGGGESALLTQAVEAAFGLGPAAVGDQIVFTRIRIRFVPPVNGTYTVTYPYGQEVFSNQVAGERVFFSSDIGIGAPGDFTGALKGAVGPYLLAVEADGVTPKPLFPIDGDLFLADPLVETQLTGSPFNTNYFEICVDDPTVFIADPLDLTRSCLRTDGFALIGKLHTAPIDSPLSVARATYTTHANNPLAHVDVFASAEAGPGAAQPNLSVGIIGAPSANMIGPRNPGGLFYGQSVIDSATIPNTVTVINSADVPPASVVATLVDAVTILESSYNATTRDLAIVAVSSDAATPPQLAAIGIPGSATGSDALIGGSLVLNLPLGTVPPESVTVVSSDGGSATAQITMPMHGAAFPTGAPLAVNDFVSTGEGIAAIFAVLANDGAEAVASSLNLITGTTNGAATANVDGTVSYTPNAGFFGFDSFTYSVASAAGLGSNIATAEINVLQINDAPIAVNDTAAAPTGVPTIIIDVIANDTDADGIAPAPGGLDPASLAISGVSVGSTAGSNGDGTVTFTTGTCSVACGFQYTVSDLGTATTAPLTSNIATVSINTASNQAPNANADAASLIVDRSITINVAANDTDPDGTVDPTTVTITSAPTGGSAVNNGDGTVTYSSPGTAGTYTFGYTIADNLGSISAQGTVTVTVNPAPDTLSIQRSECRAGKNEWRVDGSSTILSPHSVTIYAGPTVGGTVLQSNVPVDNLGTWRMNKNGGACTSIISIESSLGGKLENVFIPVN